MKYVWLIMRPLMGLSLIHICDYDNVLELLRSIYGSKVVPVQYPLETGPNFHELIDVLLMKKYSWGPEGAPCPRLPRHQPQLL